MPRREAISSIVDLLRRRAVEQPSDRAYVFLSDRGAEEATLAYSELYRHSIDVARQIAARARPGDRALLLFPAGLDFVIGFLGCMLAGLIPVPMMIPRRASSRDASAAILADCRPRLAMTNCNLAATRRDVLDRFQSAGLDWLIIDQTETASERDFDLASPEPEDIAFLQYTSGSTSAPKGVMVSHRNLIENSEMLRVALGNTSASTFVSWLPLYHDMGLILNVLQPLYVGAMCVLMAPVNFMRRPLSWLRAIHDYRAEVASAPNFAFDLCTRRHRADQMGDIDLSCWKVALNGAEPVRADTIARFVSTFAPYGFNENAMYPAYGLAEATLFVSAGRRGREVIKRDVSRSQLQCGRVADPGRPEDRQALVGCGHSALGERIAVVDPETCHRLPADHIGEVWVSGPNVTRGYWRNPDATAAAFCARIEGESETPWLRTGDLGFLDQSGELFIAGRLKDLIIVRGMNHYPQDIESSVQNVHPALRPHCGAAFSAMDRDGGEILIVIQEVERTYRNQIAADELVAAIREAVINEHEVNPAEILLLRPGALPVTTSGKVQRNLARTLWQCGGLDLID